MERVSQYRALLAVVGVNAGASSSSSSTSLEAVSVSDPLDVPVICSLWSHPSIPSTLCSKLSGRAVVGELWCRELDLGWRLFGRGVL